MFIGTVDYLMILSQIGDHNLSPNFGDPSLKSSRRTSNFLLYFILKLTVEWSVLIKF
jgi:hypothetical protein